MKATPDLINLCYLTTTGRPPPDSDSLVSLLNDILSSRVYHSVKENMDTAGVAEFVSERLKKRGVDGGVADALARQVVDDDSVYEDCGGDHDVVQGSSQPQHHLPEVPSLDVGNGDPEGGGVNFASPREKKTVETWLGDTKSALSPNQVEFLRNVSGGTNNHSDHDYMADYESDYENDFDEPSFTGPPNPSPPKHPNTHIHRRSPPPKPFPTSSLRHHAHMSLSRDLSLSSAVGSEIQEEIHIPEDLHPKQSLSPPLIADSPQIKTIKTRGGGRGEAGGSSSLPPPPPTSSNNPPSNPALNHRSPSVEDTYSSDEDHVDAENYRPSPEKERGDNRVFEVGGNPNMESVNSSSGGSVGKQLVQEALSRPHPRGATVSRRERVRKGRWKQGNKIGNGSFGTVFMGMNESSGTLMAIKSMPLFNADAKDVQDLQTEIDIMRKLSHPNIVRYFGAELNDEEGVLNIFQEWVPGGSIATLLSKMGAFSVPVVRSYLRQVLLGLEYLHGHRIIHRDIKGGNILVDNSGTVKLADFGASKKMNEEGTLNGMGMSMKGTPYFMAPEVLSHEKYGRKADMWSTGGVAMQMATGEPPWKSLGLRTPVSLFFHIQTSEDPPPMPDSVKNNPRLMNIILRCFARDPSQRPRATELLKDSFFTEEEDEDDDSETTFSDANGDYVYDDVGSDNDEGLAVAGSEANGDEIAVPPPSPSSRKTPKIQHKNKSRGFEDGYKEVGRFDVKTAKKRADLKSGRGPNSPQMYADLALNDLLPDSAGAYTEIKPAKKQPRPATTAVAATQEKPRSAGQNQQRPQTTLKTKQLERQESGYHSTEEIPLEWPSWARQKPTPAPSPVDSPASVYGTPKEEPALGGVGAVGPNPFGKDASRKQPDSNPFGDNDNGRNNPFLPKPSRESPTKFMKGPSVEQFEFDNSPKGIKENRTRARTATDRTLTARDNYSSGGSSNPDSPNAATAVTRSHGSGEKVRDAKAVGPNGSLGGAGEKWTCVNCSFKNAPDLPYCEGCATWRRVGGGKGDGREVVTVSGAWSSVKKSQDVEKGGDGLLIGAERHQAGRMRRAKSGGMASAANNRSREQLNNRDGGSKSAAAGRNYRKKYGVG